MQSSFWTNTCYLTLSIINISHAIVLSKKDTDKEKEMYILLVMKIILLQSALFRLVQIFLLANEMPTNTAPKVWTRTYIRWAESLLSWPLMLAVLLSMLNTVDLITIKFGLGCVIYMQIGEYHSNAVTFTLRLLLLLRVLRMNLLETDLITMSFGAGSILALEVVTLKSEREESFMLGLFTGLVLYMTISGEVSKHTLVVGIFLFFKALAFIELNYWKTEHAEEMGHAIVCTGCQLMIARAVIFLIP